MSKLSSIALKKIAGFSDMPKKSDKNDIDLYIDAELKGVDPKEAEEIKRKVKHGMFDIAQERGLSPVDIVRRRIGIVRNSKRRATPNAQVKSNESHGESRGNNLQTAADASKKREEAANERNRDAAWSYGGATVGGGALGALLGGEGNRLRGAIIGALLANAANFGRRKCKYGKDVIA